MPAVTRTICGYSVIAFVFLCHGEGKAQLPDCLSGFALYSEVQTVLRERNSIASGNAGSNGYLELGLDGISRGDLIAKGNILLKDRSEVSADVTAGGTATLLSGASVTGTIRENASVPACALPQISITPGTEDISVYSGATVDLAPGAYRDVKVYGSGLLKLGSGTYRFNSLVTYADARFDFNPGNGTMEILVGTSLSIGDRTQFDFAGEELPERVKFHSQQTTTLTIGTDVEFIGTLVAPLATVKAYSRTLFRGSAIGKGIDFEPDVNVVYVPFSEPPPEVQITSPADGSLTNNATIDVTWTVDGAAQTTELTEVLELEGPNTVERCVGTACDSITVTLDTQPPIVVISSPADSAYFNRTEVTVTWFVDGVQQTLQVQEMLAQEGANWIRRSATDQAGNVGRDSVPVFRDLVPPDVAILSPASGRGFNTPLIGVTWSVDGILQDTLTSQLLAEGANTVKRIGRDRAGNADSASVTVHLDTQPPMVRILHPAEGAVIHEPVITVEWQVNGVSQSQESSQSLEPGENYIVRTAGDSLGNAGSDTVRVIYSLDPPVVEILSPGQGEIVLQSPVEVRWSVDGVPQSTLTSEDLREGANAIVREVVYDQGTERVSAQVWVSLDSQPEQCLPE